MAIRYARTYENGTVVAPPKLDCLGESCHRTLYGDGCYVSKHHLYFPEEAYQSELEREFRNNPFNIVSLPRCIHDIYHGQIDEAVPPPDEIMERFLAQTAILSDIGIITDDLLMQEKRLSAGYGTKAWSRIAHSPKGREFFEYVRDDRRLKLVRFAQRAIDEVNVVPLRQIIEPHVLGARALQPMLDLSIRAS